MEEFENLYFPVFTLPEEQERETPPHSENLPNLSEMEAHFHKLLQYIESENLYLNAQLSLTSLAEKANLHLIKLSFLFNEKTGKNIMNLLTATV